MFKYTVKVLTVVLALLLTVGAVVGCNDTSDTVLSCDDLSVDASAYRYWFIQLKDYYLSSFADLKDSAEFWETEVPGLETTYGEFIDDKIRTQIEFYLAGNVLFEQYSLSLANKTVAGIDEDIDDGINAFGSRAKYDAYLESRYGVDSRELRKIKLMEQKFYAVYDHLYNAQSGVEKATSDEINSFYRDNFARIKYYMVLKEYDYVYDKDGNRVSDSSGQFTMEILDEKGKLENKLHAEEAYQKILAGESIDDYNKKYYSDLVKKFPNGYYVLENETYAALFTATVVNTTFSLEIGETALCENEDAFFIVQRQNLPDKAYSGSDKSQFSDIAKDASEAKFIKKFQGVIDTFVKNEALIKDFSVTTID